jgi:hypothetical protein
VDPVAVVQVVGEVRVVVGPGAHLGVLDGEVGDGVAVAPVVGVQLQGMCVGCPPERCGPNATGSPSCARPALRTGPASCG